MAELTPGYEDLTLMGPETKLLNAKVTSQSNQFVLVSKYYLA
jgi:hypothetical protein